MRKIKNNNTVKAFDAWLGEKAAIKKIKTWQKQNGDSTSEYESTVQTYIRNLIHHPENIKNKKYSDTELRQSIQEMVDFILKTSK